MQKIATITSKRQFTIPALIFRRLGLKEGQKILVTEEKGRIRLEPAVTLVERLAASVEIPARFKKLSLEEIIKKAKQEHFSKR